MLDKRIQTRSSGCGVLVATAIQALIEIIVAIIAAILELLISGPNFSQIVGVIG